MAESRGSKGRKLRSSDTNISHELTLDDGVIISTPGVDEYDVQTFKLPNTIISVTGSDDNQTIKLSRTGSLRWTKPDGYDWTKAYIHPTGCFFSDNSIPMLDEEHTVYAPVAVEEEDKILRLFTSDPLGGWDGTPLQERIRTIPSLKQQWRRSKLGTLAIPSEWKTELLAIQETKRGFVTTRDDYYRIDSMEFRGFDPNKPTVDLDIPPSSTITEEGDFRLDGPATITYNLKFSRGEPVDLISELAVIE